MSRSNNVAAPPHAPEDTHLWKAGQRVDMLKRDGQ